MTPAARRTLATRAELAALSLRRLAASLDHAAPVLATPRARGIVEADRAEACGALERLADVLPDPARVREAGAMMGEPTADDNGPERLREWAAAWDAFALEMDP